MEGQPHTGTQTVILNRPMKKLDRRFSTVKTARYLYILLCVFLLGKTGSHIALSICGALLLKPASTHILNVEHGPIHSGLTYAIGVVDADNSVIYV